MPKMPTLPMPADLGQGLPFGPTGTVLGPAAVRPPLRTDKSPPGGAALRALPGAVPPRSDKTPPGGLRISGDKTPAGGVAVDPVRGIVATIDGASAPSPDSVSRDLGAFLEAAGDEPDAKGATVPPDTNRGVAPPANPPKLGMDKTPPPKAASAPAPPEAESAAAPPPEPASAPAAPPPKAASALAPTLMTAGGTLHGVAKAEPSHGAAASGPHGDLDDAGLFERWDREAERGHGVDQSDDYGEEELLRPPRTPQQEARRMWFLRIVALVVGFLGMGGVSLFVWRVYWGPPPAPAVVRPPPSALAPVATSAQPIASVAAQKPTVAVDDLPPPPPPSSAEAAQSKLELPGLGLTRPPTTDPAVDQVWADAAQSLAGNDFQGADDAFARLGKRSDPATRETARLARVLLWISAGRGEEVQPVVADLASKATTESVRKRAQELLRGRH
jgi:hypothetical protein